MSKRSEMRKEVKTCVAEMGNGGVTVAQMHAALLDTFPDLREKYAVDVFDEFLNDDIRNALRTLKDHQTGLPMFYNIEHVETVDDEGNLVTGNCYYHVSQVVESDDLTRLAATGRIRHIKGCIEEVEKLIAARQARNPRFQMPLPWKD